jgi:hypothetical protein
MAWKLHERLGPVPKLTGRPARAFNQLEAKLARLLDEWGIDHQWQFRLGRYVYDFLLPGRILIEVHGEYFHPDPKAGTAGLSPSRRRALVHDASKRLFAAGHGFRLRVVWERDLNAGRVRREDVAGRGRGPR